MIILHGEKDVEELTLDEGLKDIARNTLRILDEAYGKDRDPKTDLGGFLVIMESEEDIERLKECHLDLSNDIPEYSDYIAGKDDNWIVSLYLLSSDYSITVIIPMHMAPIEMMQEQDLMLDSVSRYYV